MEEIKETIYQAELMFRMGKIKKLFPKQTQDDAYTIGIKGLKSYPESIGFKIIKKQITSICIVEVNNKKDKLK